MQATPNWSVIRDGAGREIRVLNIGKRHLSDVSIKLFIPDEDVLARRERVLNMNINEDDVVLLTYPKSGTHWLWEIITMLLSGKAEHVPWRLDRDFLDKQGDKIENNPSPKVITTHYSIGDLPRDVFKKNVKIVYVSRNPKSVAVSLYHHLKTAGYYGENFPETFSEFVPLFIDEKNYLGQYWYYYVTEVENFCKDNLDYPIINLKYEEIKQNPHKEIQRLAEFLKIETSASLVADIISKCDISNLKSVRGNTKDGGKPYMYRKGTVSDWKNWLTVADNEAFDKVYQERMAESDLKFEY